MEPGGIKEEGEYLYLEEETNDNSPGPLEQTGRLLKQFRTTITIIILLLVAIFLTFSFFDTSEIRGLGLNNGKYQCKCDPGWANKNSTLQCIKPVVVDRGKVPF